MAGTITKGLIGKEDLSQWDGTSTRSFTRTTSSGYALTLHDVDYQGVDILTVYGGGSLNTKATVDAALTAIGTTNVVGVWFAPGTWVFSASADYSAYDNITFIIPQGASLEPATGTTLTVSNIQAGPYKIFGGAGTVKSGVPVHDVYPEWWGAYADGIVDCSTAIQAAMDFLPVGTDNAGGEIVFGTGTYYIATGLTRGPTAPSRLALVGRGKRITNIETDQAITMFACEGTDGGPLAGYIEIRGIRFYGNDLATCGLKFEHCNYLTLDDVRVMNVVGEGIYIDDVEDITVTNCHIFYCGSFADSKAGFASYKNGTDYNNSIHVMGCTFERGPYHQFYAKSTSELSLHGNKFHGQTAADASPALCDEVDLLYLDDCQATMIVGNQFTQARRRSITNADTGAYWDASITIIGNHFIGIDNFALGATDCGHIYHDNGSAVIEGNLFHGRTGGLYESAGYDIQLSASSFGATGNENYHLETFTRTAKDFLIANNDPWYPVPILMTKGGWRAQVERYIASTAMTDNMLEFWAGVDTQVYPRFSISPLGELAWGTGLVEQDTELIRGGAGLLKAKTGTNIWIQGGTNGETTWTDGHLIIGKYHLWVDTSNKLRISATAPTGDTDGTVVGTQT